MRCHVNPEAGTKQEDAGSGDPDIFSLYTALSLSFGPGVSECHPLIGQPDSTFYSLVSQAQMSLPDSDVDHGIFVIRPVTSFA